MPLTKVQKVDITKKYGTNDKDTGSVGVRVALLTQRIKELIEHFRQHPKDHHSRRGLLQMVGQRRRLLNYLSRKDIEKYRSLIKELEIRR